MSNSITSKRFVIRKSLVGQNSTINVEFKSGKTFTYNHDKVYEIMKDKLEKYALLYQIQKLHFFNKCSSCTKRQRSSLITTLCFTRR